MNLHCIRCLKSANNNNNIKLKREIEKLAFMLIVMTMVLKSLNHWWRRTQWFIEILS